jgi:hypothetical protein
MMNVRSYEPNDYEMVYGWFRAHGWPNPPVREHLPKLGWIAEDDEGALAVGWVYLSVDTPIGFMEWTCTNPDRGTRGLRGLKEMMEVATKDAASMGCPILFQLMPNEKLVKFYKNKLGFKEVERGTIMVHMEENQWA